MPAGETNATPSTPKPERIHIFVDFWNFELSLKDVVPTFKTDWIKLPQVIFQEAASILKPASGADYVGMSVFGSYNAATETRLKNWATVTLASFPGTSVDFVARRRVVKGPTCPNCHNVVTDCPFCNGSMLGTKEKGVDTRIATNMIRMAWENLYDSAVIITADEDLSPAASFLSTKGIRVLHAKFPPFGAHLSRVCWANFAIPPLMPRFQRP